MLYTPKLEKNVNQLIIQNTFTFLRGWIYVSVRQTALFIMSLCIIYTNQQGHTSARNKKGMIKPVEHFKGKTKKGVKRVKSDPK